MIWDGKVINGDEIVDNATRCGGIGRRVESLPHRLKAVLGISKFGKSRSYRTVEGQEKRSRLLRS